ncbi:protein ENHANCED PSEUDOMONAS SUSCEPTIBILTY 1-like [Chenopodium quinoa]|uniref:Uncharacterized protein n=1 Tax=Chenopodium quinoa TaxID=63459 RepID=A0A803LPJ0_CHEQI|nr:protein ENHANCED PSEUDOMONAS SUSCEPTIBILTY 1-like [Chenopodium quinoa]
MEKIKLISECFVKPKYEVEAAKQPYHLSPKDLALLSLDPIQKGLLFTLNTPPSADHVYGRIEVVSHLLERLKHSLSIALVHFYPLAGRFVTCKYPDEHACSVYIDCNKGPGARLIHATVLDVSVFDIISSIDVPTIVSSFFELGEKMVNYDGHTRALLSIQVTELVYGVFMGFTISHSVVDGTSFIHFVSILSEIFRSNNEHIKDTTKISRTPIFSYNPCIKNGIDNQNGTIFKLPHLEPAEFITHGYDPSPLRHRIFHFSHKSLVSLKAKANQEYKANNVISSFQALTALVWRSITRARNLTTDQLTSCIIILNTRTRLNPVLSDDYFGNFVTKAKCECTVDELLGHNLGWAAKNLQEAILAQDEKRILELWNPTKALEVNRRNPTNNGPESIIIGGSGRFDMYGPEFGLGRALAIRMGCANWKDAKVTVNPGCEGGGSMDWEISLRPHAMATLESDFEFMSFVSL